MKQNVFWSYKAIDLFYEGVVVLFSIIIASRLVDEFVVVTKVSIAGEEYSLLVVIF